MYIKPAVVFAMSAFITACSPGSGPGPGGFASLTGSDTPSAVPSSNANDSDDQLRIRHLMELRQRYRGSSNSAGLNELHRAETEAAKHFLAAGSDLARAELFQEAIEKYDLGLLAQPSDAELLQARQTAGARKEVARLYTEGERAKSVGNLDLADTLFQKAANFDPQNEALKKEVRELDRAKEGNEQRYVLAAFRSQDPVAMNFRDAKLKDALEVVSEPHRLNFVFDKNAENLDVNVSAKNVSFEQAFNMVLRAANAGYKVLGPNSIFLYEDTPEKRKQHADLYFKTFHLSTLKAERMAELLKASMEIKTLVANNDLGIIQVRDTRDTLDVVEKLIAANDRKPAEIMLNVEILEVNRNKSDQLGIDWGSQIAISPQGVAAAATGSAAATGAAAAVGRATLQTLAEGSPLLKQSMVTLPTVTLNYLRTAVDARTLSNPSDPDRGWPAG